MSPHMEQGNFKFKLPGWRNRPTVGLLLKGHGVPFIVRVILPIYTIIPLLKLIMLEFAVVALE